MQLQRSNPDLDRLRAWLRERHDLHASLAAHDRPEALAAALAPLAAADGIDISEETLSTAIALPP
ncbi:hypothetical protein, partial [Enterococcus faecium]|uniref:hypothetical protein n=2 Tax=Bacteria TaxID=2 RepID=UPI003F43F65B